MTYTLNMSVANPVPPGAKIYTLQARDGVRLRAARWLPQTPHPKGTVCIFGGRGEFIEKYFETIHELLARGFAVATLDWRGQGKSQRLTRTSTKGHVGSFAHYLDDVQVFMQEVVLPDCPLPLFALAHSMGGAILLHALALHPQWFERAVLCAPLVDLPAFAGSGTSRNLARMIRCAGLGTVQVPATKKALAQTREFEGNLLTRDAGRFTRNAELVSQDAQLALGPPTFAWIDAAFQGMSAFVAPDFIAKIRTPLLFMVAGADQVISNAAIARLAKRLRVGGVITLDGARHEILMETDPVRAAFWAAFDAFVPGNESFPQ